jgi:polyhydroxyalkanoate synthesis regulator phasin
MDRSELLKRYLDAGMQFTQLTQRRAEAIVRDLVKAGEIQAEQTQTMVTELVERSKKNTERFVDQVRGEIRQQLKTLGVATKDDIARLERRIDEVRRSSSSTAKKANVKKSTAKKSTAKKSAAKKSAAKKAAGGTA